jgi:hypothetical protein
MRDWIVTFGHLSRKEADYSMRVFREGNNYGEAEKARVWNWNRGFSKTTSLLT